MIFGNVSPIRQCGLISSSTLLSRGFFHYLPPICTVGMLGSFTVLIMSDLTCQVTLTALKPKWPHESWKSIWAALLLLRIIFLSSLSVIPTQEAFLGDTISHWTPQGITAAHRADTLCQPTSHSRTCRACKVSGHLSPQLLISLTSPYKELGRGKKNQLLLWLPI